MPKVVRRANWEESLRKDVNSLARGWNVKERHGRVFLRVRHPEQPEQSVTLPFEWSPSCKGDAYTRIRNIYSLVHQGYNLRQAAEVATGKAPKLVEQHDWHGAVERFQQQKLQHGTTIKLATWARKYEPVLGDAVNLITSVNPPTNPLDLIEQCIRGWDPGSRTRQERTRNLAQFLRYCVAREQMPAVWLPPAGLKDLIGRPPATATSQKSHPISDQQILDLLASIPGDEAGMRWADALRLMAELGLRPIELLHLSVRTDPRSGENYWWCSYQKRAGGGVTKPRRLFPLPLIDGQGAVQQWNLLQRWHQKSIALPSLCAGNGASDAIATYLSRRSGWQSLKSEAEAKGERVSCYSFRHSYSLRGHIRRIDSGSLAFAMGHSIEVHCRSYPWATTESAVSAFDCARNAMAGPDLLR